MSAYEALAEAKELVERASKLVSEHATSRSEFDRILNDLSASRREIETAQIEMRRRT
jgi:multidrug resistance efflux pump